MVKLFMETKLVWSCEVPSGKNSYGKMCMEEKPFLESCGILFNFLELLNNFLKVVRKVFITFN